MAANDATTIPNTGMNAGTANDFQHADNSTKSAIVFRPLGWNDLDAVTELFDRTWPQDVDELGVNMSRLISRYFVLHYLQPTTFANGAFTADGTLAGVTFIRVAGEAPQLDEIEVGEEMKALERRICADSKAAKHLAALKSGFSVEIDLEHEGRANETTMGELELFIVNPDVRGHGVGGQLWQRMQEHFDAWDVPAFYLHTDSDCDVSFYDHKGLDCIAHRTAEETVARLGGGTEDDAPPLFDDMFIYRGKVKA